MKDIFFVVLLFFFSFCFFCCCFLFVLLCFVLFTAICSRRTEFHNRLHLKHMLEILSVFSVRTSFRDTVTWGGTVYINQAESSSQGHIWSTVMNLSGSLPLFPEKSRKMSYSNISQNLLWLADAQNRNKRTNCHGTCSYKYIYKFINLYLVLKSECIYAHKRFNKLSFKKYLWNKCLYSNSALSNVLMVTSSHAELCYLKSAHQ